MTDSNAALYALPTDEVGHLATVTLATGVADPNYPVTNVQTFDPSEPFLTSSSGTAVDIDFDHGTALDVQYVSIHHSNIPAGELLHIYRGATQGATTFDLGFTTPSAPQIGLPLPIGQSLIDASGYNPSGYRWTRLHIPSMAQLVGIGSVMLWGTVRQDLTNVRYPVADVERQPATPFRTSYGVKRTKSLNIRLRSTPASFRFLTDAEYASFLSLFRTCQGPVNAFLWVRNPTDPDAWLASFSEDSLSRSLPRNSVSDVTLTIEELACGKALPIA